MTEKELIDEIVTELYKRLAQTSQCHKKAFIMGCMDHTLLQRLSGNYDIIGEDEETADCEIYLITELPFPTLAHLALGSPHNKKEEIILRALLLGKKVYVLESGIEIEKYKETAYKNLLQVYQEYILKLSLYGVQMIVDLSMLGYGGMSNKCSDKDNVLKNYQSKDPFILTNSSLDFTKKKVLLEKDLINYHLQNNSMIILDKKCIITPLAEDYIKMHMISIQKK